MLGAEESGRGLVAGAAVSVAERAVAVRGAVLRGPHRRLGAVLVRATLAASMRSAVFLRKRGASDVHS